MQKYIKNYLNSVNKLPHELSCELCGGCNSLDIHHVHNRQKNRPDLDEASNLICACRDCHANIHANNTQETKQQLINIINERSA